MRLLEPRLRAGAAIVVDNIDMAPELTAMLQENPHYVVASLGAEVELLVRCADA